jgi:hypothetical protein
MRSHTIVAAALIGAALNTAFDHIAQPCELPEHHSLGIFAAGSQVGDTRQVTSVASSDRSGQANLKIVPSSFVAWIDRMPNVGGKLIVEGAVATPSPGWRVQLAPSRHCPTDEGVLLLKLTAASPRRTAAQGVVTIPVRYEQKGANVTLVKIVMENCDGFTLPITEVF